MNFYKTILFCALAFFTIGHWACKGPVTDYDREKVYLDSLDNLLTGIKVALNVDEEVLKTRIAKVNTWYPKLGDTTYEVAQKMRIDFNGFKVVYQNYIDNFFPYRAAADMYEKQYKKLEEDVKEQTLSRDDFKKQYAQLKKDIEYNYAGATTLAQPVYDLEFTWKRYENLSLFKR